MKILVLTGSPRKNGNSNTLVDNFIKGAEEKVHKPKKAALFMTYADTAEFDAEPIKKHYEVLLNYLGWTSVGEIIASGVWQAGSINQTKYPQKAYEFGKSL